MMAAVSLLLTGLVIPTGGPIIKLFGVGPEATAIGQNFSTTSPVFMWCMA